MIISWSISCWVGYCVVLCRRRCIILSSFLLETDWLFWFWDLGSWFRGFDVSTWSFNFWSWYNVFYFVYSSNLYWLRILDMSCRCVHFICACSFCRSWLFSICLYSYWFYFANTWCVSLFWLLHMRSYIDFVCTYRRSIFDLMSLLYRLNRCFDRWNKHFLRFFLCYMRTVLRNFMMNLFVDILFDIFKSFFIYIFRSFVRSLLSLLMSYFMCCLMGCLNFFRALMNWLSIGG